MDRIKIEVFVKKLDQLVEQFPEVFKDFTYSFLNWDFWVLWKIDKWIVSRIIQAFTQSLYSHVAFCVFKNWDLRVFWAENLKKVEIKKYPIKWKNCFYVLKQFDSQEVMKYFDKNDYANTLLFFLWEKCAENFKKRYELFLNYFSSDKFKHGISLMDLVEFDLKYELNDELLKLQAQLNHLKQKISQIKLYGVNAHSVSEKFLQKLFLTWWLFKFVVYAYGEKYDFSGALSIIFSPFRKRLFENNWKLFCSEFVSSAMLYAGFYPFDMLTKSPSMITPGDLMDPSFWIWKNHYKLIDAKTGKIYNINDYKSMKLAQKMLGKEV